MIDEALLDTHGVRALESKSVYCWPQNTAADRRFAEAFRAQTGHSVHCYALMAYESGQLIARAAQEIGPTAGNYD